jgi:DNA-binding transcriptional LysR family regulator
MSWDLERLRVLHAIALHGSVTAAADALHVTTSAISQQTAKLQREVGQRLFEREGRSIRLTPAGELLADHATRILSDFEEARTDLEAHRGTVIGSLSLAAFPTAARGLVPGALCALQGRHRRLNVTLRELEPEQSLPLVGRGGLDLAIVQDWANAPLQLPADLAHAGLLEDAADIAVPENHPLARRTILDITDIQNESWISWPVGSLCHNWLVSHALATAAAAPRIVHTAGEGPTHLALVAGGHGIALSFRLGRDPVPAGVTMVPVRPRLCRNVYAVWRRNATRRPAIRAVIAALRSTADALPGGANAPDAGEPVEQ